MRMTGPRGQLAGYILVVVLGSLLSGWMAWTIIAYRDSSNFDSGWIAADNKSSHTVRIGHNLAKVPSQLTVWFSPTANGDLSVLVTGNWTPEYSGNPVSIFADKNIIGLSIVQGFTLRGVWTAETDWKRYSEGYYRVIAK